MTFNKATISFGEFAVFSGFLVDNCYLYDIFMISLFLSYMIPIQLHLKRSM